MVRILNLCSWEFLAVGARRPASRIMSSLSCGSGVFLNSRTLKRSLINFWKLMLYDSAIDKFVLSFFMWPYLLAGGIIFLFVVVGVFFVYFKSRKPAQVERDDIDVLVDYVKAQKQEAEEVARVKFLKKEEQRTKLETFKQTKDQLKEKLKSQIDGKQWQSLESILRSADKGGVGIYIIYNTTKDKYYVGQAKQLFARVRKHFDVPDLARDFLTGDKLQVKFLTSNELDDNYRLDHVEKTGIEIFDADKSGYNRNTGIV